MDPYHSGRILELRQGLWLLWPQAVRRIPESAKIHASVFSRMENFANRYHHRNLSAQYRKVES